MARRPSGQQLIALGALAAAIATIVIALLGFIRYPLVIALSFIAVAAVFEGVILIVTPSTSRGGSEFLSPSAASSRGSGS